MSTDILVRIVAALILLVCFGQAAATIRRYREDIVILIIEKNAALDAADHAQKMYLEERYKNIEHGIDITPKDESEEGEEYE